MRALMPEDKDLISCPFCEGRGKMHRSEIVQELNDPELPRKITDRLFKSAAEATSKHNEPELAGANTPPKKNNFYAEVGSWNNHDVWHRSPKE
jgi:hypothetical protein